jgi:hypothetical protein
MARRAHFYRCRTHTRTGGNTMSKLRPRLVAAAGLAVAAATACLLSASATAAHAAAPTTVTVNSYYYAGYAPNKVARGAFLTLHLNGQVSNEETTFSPWPTTTPAGVYVEASPCSSGSTIRLPIVEVFGYATESDVSVYLPNDLGSEPFGTCDTAAGLNAGISTTFTVHPAPGYGAAVSTTRTTFRAYPMIFDVGRTTGLHINVVTGLNTPIEDCNFDVYDCPVATLDSNGVLRQNVLLVNLTGAEALSCGPTTGTCSFIGFRLTSGSTRLGQTTVSVSSIDPGVEQARIVLSSAVTAGCWSLTATVFGSLLIQPNQDVPVCLDSAS